MGPGDPVHAERAAMVSAAASGVGGQAARSRWAWASLAVPLLVAIGLAAWTGRTDRDATEPATPSVTSAAPVAPVELQADTGPRAATVDDLVRASDVVVEGTVVATQRGRAVGTARQGIVTRLVEVRVDRVLAGDVGVVGTDGSVIVEEEGWLADGRPVRVNGVEPSAVGDRGVYFLVRGTGEEFPYTAVVSDQGRYLLDPADPTRVRPSGSADPLVRRIEAEGVSALVPEVAG